MSILIFIISLAILILVHEFGHFIAAKKSGIRVDEFGLGFPPKLWSKKIGETLYTLNLIPFGGFVKIYGEDPHSENIPDSERPRSMYYKPKWIQAIVLVAGVTMNVLFAWLLISIGFMIGLPSPVAHTGAGLVVDAHVVVLNTLPESPAAAAGLHSGDTILFVSAPTETGVVSAQEPDINPDTISNIIAGSTGDITFMYRRGDAGPATVFITPSTDVVEGKRAIGIAMDTIGILKLPVHTALIEGARTTVLLTQSVVVGLGNFLWGIITFKSDFSQVTGPVGIAGTVGEAQSLGFVYLLSLIALISINLAVINLIPFPALDGGRLLFVLIESIIRRPIPTGFVRWTNALGFLFLLTLMGIVTIKDIFKLF